MNDDVTTTFSNTSLKTELLSVEGNAAEYNFPRLFISDLRDYDTPEKVTHIF